MTTYQPPRAWAIVMATICGGLVAARLVEGARETGFTLDHALSLGVLVITIGAGKMVWQQAMAWRPLHALGLAIITVGGLAYTIVSTAGPVAEQQQRATARANANVEARGKLETERKRVVDLRTKAEAMLTDAQGKHAKECATGRGTKCGGIKATIEVYEGTVKGRNTELAEIDGKLEALSKASAPANGKLLAAAELLEALSGISKATTLDRLTTVWPYVPPILFEIGSIVFGIIAGGSSGAVKAQQQVPATPAPANEKPAPTPPRGTGKRGRKVDPKVISFAAEYRARHGGSGPTGSAIMQAFPGMPKSTAYDYAQRVA